jgi:hypothetical protein
VIDYAKVQSKVSLKYDSWHKEALGKFGSLLGNDMSQFHTQVSKVRPLDCAVYLLKRAPVQINKNIDNSTTI